MKEKTRQTTAFTITAEQWGAISAEFRKDGITPRQAALRAGLDVNDGCGIVSEAIQNRLSFAEFQVCYADDIATLKEARRIRDAQRREIRYIRSRDTRHRKPAPDLFCMFGRSATEMLAAAKRVGFSVHFAQIN